MSDEWNIDFSKSDNRVWTLLEKSLLANVQEHKRARRWSIFFKLMTLGYATLFLFFFLGVGASSMGVSPSSAESHVALIDIQGEITDVEGSNADSINTALKNAFDSNFTKAVILRINSPGGSPVQSAYVYDEMMRLKQLNPKVKIYAVITDLGASGAYYIASAADSIYADKSSLVGSIGVTAAGFGFVDVMNKVGVQRRLYTAGEHKAFLDPFSPQNSTEVSFWDTVLASVHQQFIQSVVKGRGDRLKYQEHPELFSGLIWSGELALPLGLIDGFGSSDYVAREVVKEENIVDYTIKPNPFDRIASGIGSSAAIKLASILGIDQIKLN